MLKSKIRNQIGLFLIAILILSVGLAWISTGLRTIQGFGSFLAMTALGGVVLAAAWWSLKAEAPPRWLGWLLVGGVLLRLAVGVTWFLVLPKWGHGTDVELAGYVMSDAHRRDLAAWDLAQSEDSLLSAFQDYRLADQYGGMLYVSAAVYRFLGSDTHQPLMMVVLTASFSALTILYGWALTRRLWGGEEARIAAWILFIYPEAILLGSSQMREAFLMPLVGMAVYGLILYWQEHKWQGIAWVIAVLSLSLPLSTLFAVMLLAVLIGLMLVLGKAQILRNWVLWMVLVGLLVVGLVGIWLLGDRIYPEGASNPLELISQWLVFAARWEKHTIIQLSAWFEKILLRSPEWMHTWLILGYGTVQPFLPAAVIATGIWSWRLIAIWRAAGWTFLLVLLLYAPIRAGQKIRKTYIAAGLALIVWFGVLLAAFRGGGDQWDNPRYRVVFVVLQAALAAWVWARQRKESDPWLRRVLVGMGFVFAWFIPWYLRRYSATFEWPIIDLFKTLGLGFISAGLYWVWDWARCANPFKNL